MSRFPKHGTPVRQSEFRCRGYCEFCENEVDAYTYDEWATFTPLERIEVFRAHMRWTVENASGPLMNTIQL